ncbi:serine/threonine protein kinase [Nocardia sp. 2]|uniref:non-specific serine/threonine protein kinase n=1 Tax=Nocardia acididurans TaxID=2802282 RepID=A0ABS1M052_9NOCA|nr:serine/threonine-protein kinase [Nocardia acididurans]MBL1073886.1 serine/threonine protein kinase [Nocardia acididurans]
MELTEGTLFAGYRIERRLGSGGMGTVYLARHPRLPRSDALKVLSGDSVRGGEFRRRFLREAEFAARLHHPNLITVHDRGETGEHLWIAMQYVDGIDVRALIARGPDDLDPPRAIHILTEAARGLDEIHAAGLVHRDVKPANILIAEQPGKPDRVLVTDFGIARPADESTDRTGAGGFAGTLAYTAPEVVLGEHIDQRADAYSLGCTLYQMLTGSVPFPHSNSAAVVHAHVHETPPRPSARNPSIPAEFDAVIAKAMAKRRENRYSSCGELAAAAAAALHGNRTGRAGSRRLGYRMAVAMLVAALAIAAAVLFDGNGFRWAAQPVAATSNPPVTGTIESAEWGELAYIAEAFATLLPGIPWAAGYQELSMCDAFSDSEESTNMLFCSGNSDPAWTVMIECNPDRTPILPSSPLTRIEGNLQWTRPTGSGNLFWGSEIVGAAGSKYGQRMGVLNVYFDDPERNFCWISVWGVVSAPEDLVRLWWNDAPL